MRTFCFAAIAALSFFPRPAAALDQKRNDMLCAEVARFAEGTMRARQRGRPLDELLEAARTKLTPQVAELEGVLASDAYRTPQFSDTNTQEVVIGYFRDNWRLNCLRHQSAKK